MFSQENLREILKSLVLATNLSVHSILAGGPVSLKEKVRKDLDSQCLIFDLSSLQYPQVSRISHTHTHMLGW